MRHWSLLLCLLVAACAERAPFSSYTYKDPPPPPSAVWQEGPSGLVYARSPFALWPEGERGIVQLPTTVFFRPGQAELDVNGHNVVVLQALRLRQLPDLAITLFCGWSSAEAEDAVAGRRLAAARCDAVSALYQSLGVRTQDLRYKLVAPSSEAISTAEQDVGSRSVSVTAVATGRTSAAAPLSHKYQKRELITWGDQPDYLFYSTDFAMEYPGSITFPLNSAVLDGNAKGLLNTVADVYEPRFSLYFLTCIEIEGEDGSDKHDRTLARDRCEAIRDHLVSRGFCPWRIIHGPGGRQWWSEEKALAAKPHWPLGLTLPYAYLDVSPDSPTAGLPRCTPLYAHIFKTWSRQAR